MYAIKIHVKGINQRLDNKNVIKFHSINYIKSNYGQGRTIKKMNIILMTNTTTLIEMICKHLLVPYLKNQG